jgi:hypothetical protein
MSRREILADTLARLEAERYAPRASWKASRPGQVDPPPMLTAEQQAENRRVLAEALGEYDDYLGVVLPHREAS